jgi:hypothetical protein
MMGEQKRFFGFWASSAISLLGAAAKQMAASWRPNGKSMGCSLSPPLGRHHTDKPDAAISIYEHYAVECGAGSAQIPSGTQAF